MGVVVVAAHPDDEIIGAGLFLRSLRRPCLIVHVTDGAPRSGADARAAGCATWREYAHLRRVEFGKAIAAAGIEAATFSLRCPDQQAAWRIAQIATRLTTLFQRQTCPVVLTHAYEGGHPDHDSTAAAVHAAACLSGTTPRIIEFASYHRGDAGMECECFVDDALGPKAYRPLTKQQREWKRAVLRQYASQNAILANFPLRYEPLRAAPAYDFSRPPHGGPLYYDRFNWGIASGDWRRLAVDALRALDVPCVC